MNMKIETVTSVVASAVAIFISVGTVFYQAVAIKKDVEKTSAELVKTNTEVQDASKKVQNIETELAGLKANIGYYDLNEIKNMRINLGQLETDIRYHNTELGRINQQITVIQEDIHSTSEQIVKTLTDLVARRK